MSEILIDKLFRSRRRSLGLEITQDALLVVRAPHRASLEYIQNVLLKKADWILKKQAQAQARKVKNPPKKFVDGENFYYLGKPYLLKLVDVDTISLTDYLEFPRIFLLDAQQRLTQWYKRQASEKVKERVELYSKITGLAYSKIKISHAAKRMGSCSVNGNLNFSWRLVMAPLENMDYVVVHELIHLDERNHSRRFWNKVRAVLPDYKEKDSWLKDNFRLFCLDGNSN